MYKLKIINEKDGVTIKNIRNGMEMYEASNYDLEQIDEENLSKMILHLREKSWINTDTLYELAKVIALKFLNIFIDWNKTFFYVEKVNYLKFLDEVLQIKEESKELSTYEKLVYKNGENNAVIEQYIEKIVKNKLCEFGL